VLLLASLELCSMDSLLNSWKMVLSTLFDILWLFCKLLKSRRWWLLSSEAKQAWSNLGGQIGIGSKRHTTRNCGCWFSSILWNLSPYTARIPQSNTKTRLTRHFMMTLFEISTGLPI
jgi:hypothetical protein